MIIFDLHNKSEITRVDFLVFGFWFFRAQFESRTAIAELSKVISLSASMQFVNG